MNTLPAAVDPDGAHPSPPAALGLTSAEASARLRTEGPNRLPEPPERSRLAMFVDQFRNLLVVVLFGAAVLAGLVGDWKDTIVISVVLLLNGVLGFLQEGKAERSLAALRSMLVDSARVRRDGEVTVVPAADLVVGDVVLLDAGDRVPADGLVRAAASLEVDESSLTGESTPVTKSTEPSSPDAPLAERHDQLFMNTTVTRGRAEVEVSATGAATEIGKLAGMLQAADPGRTPLQESLDALGKRLAVVAGVAVAVFLALQLLRGETVADAVLDATALAVAAIPEGLPAVVTVTLAIGVAQLAKRGAVVKRLASVETLGSTTVICSDKTGTLTLNRMTVREVRRAEDRGRLLDAAALCSDAVLRDGAVVGDPTEGALVELAAAEGIDVEARRFERPRRAEAPFESATKVMATVHDDAERPGTLVAFVKGAPDVLLPRCRGWADDATRASLEAELEALASEGLRVLAVAERRAIDPAELDDLDLVALDGLDLLGLVGLVDPARPEARDAIAVCRRAGIAVKMITGDHQATASAIARQLGLEGGTLSGRQLDDLDDEQLGAVVDETAVFARVTPAHKVRLVRVLQERGHVVAMTGDGVNDAPALKSADIGVAMGITGTEVTKEASDLVLTDDDFATIVRAVRSGRTIYANIVHFVRFQLSTNIGAIATMLGAVALGLPTPFTALQVLWINLIMDGPPAMALGVDPASPRAMEEGPRRPGSPILSARRLRNIGLAGAIMAVGTLGILVQQREVVGEAAALTVAFTTFVLFQVFNVMNVRSETETVFSRATLRNRLLWIAIGGVVVLQVLAVQLPALQGLFDTTAMTAGQWALSIAVASTVLWVEEARKALSRRP